VSDGEVSFYRVGEWSNLGSKSPESYFSQFFMKLENQIMEGRGIRMQA